MNTSPILPLDLSSGAIASYTDDQIKELIKQNVKMVLLTHPGERIMWPEFGVGLSGYLFELQNTNVPITIKRKIQDQLSKWIPTIQLLNIRTSVPANQENTLGIVIEYQIDFLRRKDFLELLLEY